MESAEGLVGVVHADVPAGMSWNEFIGSLDNVQIEQVALWGRERVIKHYREGIQGVWRVCAGHTWIPQPLRLGNFLALDSTGGGEGPLAIFCVSAEVITERMQELEQVLTNLKAMINNNKLIESQSLSAEAETLIKHANSAWLSLRDDLAESQKLINALHGLSLLPGNRKVTKLEELKARYEGSHIRALLQRLFD